MNKFGTYFAGSMPNLSLRGTSSKASPTTSSVSDTCENCGINPKFVESNGRIHPYCGRSCAAEYKRASQQIPSYGKAPATRYQPQNDWVKLPPDCLLRDCKNQGRPQFGGFCSDSHSTHAMRKNYVKACSQCGSMPQTSGDMCIACQRFQGTTTLNELHHNDMKFKSVVSTFVDSWTTTKKAPRVMKVLEVNLSRKGRNGFEAYRKYLQKQSQPFEIPTFHSSQCVCDLGTKSSHQLCEYPSCGLCSAVRSNFTKFAFGAPYNSGSQGDGVYSYTSSSRADKHATSCTTSPYRATILCSVLVENSHTTKSVVNGDTVVVADADAIIPTHILLYSST
ncbi:hypothetical protein M0805_007673 [Coniferiporia weirii]|nr:hypothetical protein M0805_007673 [Coniferiporia weirii]